jgi:hypothetical protein
MRTFAITLFCLALAVLLTSFVPLGTGDTPLPNSGTAMSTFDLTLAAGPLATPEYVDAH